jgi:hypothetical protein
MGHLIQNFKTKKIEDIIENWEHTGLISNEMVKNKQNVALSYELTALYLLSKSDFDSDKNDLSTLIFPVMCRIFSKYEENLTTDTIFEEVVKIIKEFQTKLESTDKTEWLKPFVDTDYEAEFIFDFCANYSIKK